MKNLRRAIVLIVLLCFLAGCAPSPGYIAPPSVNFNYNNITSSDSDFWLTQDALYDSRCPVDITRHYRITESKTTKFFAGYHSDFQAYGNEIYLLKDVVDFKDSDLRCFYSYNLDTQKKKKIGYAVDVITFFVFQEQLYYIQKSYAPTGKTYKKSFYTFDLTNNTKACIAENILFAGVMGDTVVFLTQENDTFILYAYDGNITERGRFQYQFTPDKALWDYCVNFTADTVLLQVNAELSTELVCFNVAQNRLNIHEIDSFVDSVIAYDQYAFAITGSYVDDKASLWRIRLSDGARDDIEQFSVSHPSSVESFVESDERVFIRVCDEDQIYCYSVNGEKTLVYEG